MKKSGQALIEFVLILPIFIFLILAIIDMGKIIYYKNRLENQINSAIEVYLNDRNQNELETYVKKLDKKFLIDVNYDGDYLEFQLSKPIDIITPGLNLILKSPYNVQVKRVIYDES